MNEKEEDIVITMIKQREEKNMCQENKKIEYIFLISFLTYTTRSSIYIYIIIQDLLKKMRLLFVRLLMILYMIGVHFADATEKPKIKSKTTHSPPVEIWSPHEYRNPLYMALIILLAIGTVIGVFCGFISFQIRKNNHRNRD